LDREEKNMLLGAAGTGMTDMALEALWISNPAYRDKFPFVAIHETLPPVDDLLACGGIPLVLYALGKKMRRQDLVDAAKGAAVYGVSELTGVTVLRFINYLAAHMGQFNIDYEFPTTNLIRQFNIDYDFPSTNLIRQASWMDRQKVTKSEHSGEYFPFQTDMRI